MIFDCVYRPDTGLLIRDKIVLSFLQIILFIAAITTVIIQRVVIENFGEIPQVDITADLQQVKCDYYKYSICIFVVFNMTSLYFLLSLTSPSELWIHFVGVVLDLKNNHHSLNYRNFLTEQNDITPPHIGGRPLGTRKFPARRGLLTYRSILLRRSIQTGTFTKAFHKFTCQN